MAQTGYTPIQLYYSSTTTNVPLAAKLAAGELAINTADGKLFYKDSGGTVQVLAGKGGSGIVAGSTGQVQFNNAGVFGASSNFFWDNSNAYLGIGTSSPVSKLQVGGGLSGSNATYVGDIQINGNPASLAQTGGLEFKTSTFGSGYGWKISSIDSSGVQLVFGTRQNSATWSEAMRIDSSGNVLVGTTNANMYNATTGSGINLESGSNTSIARSGSSVALNINKTDYSSGTTYFMQFTVNNSEKGTISSNGSTTSYTTSSDYRLKDNVAPMTGALDTIAQLKPVTYKWKLDGSNGQGFIAHELQEIVPDCVSGEKDATKIEQYEISPAIPATYDDEGNELTPAVEAVMGEREVPVYQGIDTSFLVATLTAALQEAHGLIKDLQNRVDTLEGK